MARLLRGSLPADLAATAAARVGGLLPLAEPTAAGWVPGDDDDDDLIPPPGWLPGVETSDPAVDAVDAVPQLAYGGLGAAVRGALADRLPAVLRGGRVDPRRAGVLALAVVALVAALVAGWALLRARPVAVDAPAAPTVTTPSVPSPTAHADVIVDIAGKVAHPGLVTLPAGSRIADAIRAAGGVLPGTEAGLLNLASKLSDGQQVLVGVGPPPGAGVAAGVAAGDGTIDLNAATEAQLEQLPGVGPVLAQRILDWRRDHGSFASVDQLREVSGIGDRKFADLRAKVRV